MKNRFKLLLGLLITVLIISCDDEYVAPNTVLDAAWYTNQKNGIDYKVRVGEHMSFMDLSQGAVAHSWTIEEGNKYLNTGFDNKSDLSAFIDTDKGLVNEDLTVHILFNNPGVNKVRLFNTYDQELIGVEDDGITVKKVGDQWVLDTSFVVDVYGELMPAFKVIKVIDDNLGNILREEEILSVDDTSMVSIEDSASWLEIEMEAGSRLKLIDMTKRDRPNARVWTINNQKIASAFTDSVALVYFNSLGHINVVGNLKSQRLQQAGDDTPAASATKVIPLKVNVVKSSKPFIAINKFNEIEGQEAFAFVVSGEVASMENAEASISVHAYNASTGFDEDIAVSAVRTSAQDASIIEVILADTIYGNDRVTVSFDNAVGTITSIDGRLLDSFSDQVLEMAFKGENLFVDDKGAALRWVGYEEERSTNANKAYMTEDANTGVWWASQIAFYKSDEKSFTGEASLKFEGDASAKNQLWRMNPEFGADIPKSTLIVRQRIYVSAGSDIKVLTNTLGAQTSSGWADHLTMHWDVSEAAVPRDQWVLLEQEVVNTLSSTDPAVKQMRWMVTVLPAQNEGISADQTFYLDDLEIIPVESRP